MRISTWEDALVNYIIIKRDEPFEYGVNDCCLFAAGAVEAITGEDPMSEFRGKYDSLKGSIKAIKDIGAGTLEATLDGKFPEVSIGYAQRGDLAFFDDSIGVVMGGFAYFVSDDGLERIPRDMWNKCWSVGRG
jgi:hypothetical protein